MLAIGVGFLILIAGGLLGSTLLAGSGREGSSDQDSNVATAEQIAAFIAMSSGLGRGDIAQFGPRSLTVTRAHLTLGNGARRQRFDSETIALHGLVYDQRARVEYISPPRGDTRFDART